jgi:hypothetical protein
MASEREAIWAERVAKWRESGLTSTAYAAEAGVNAKTLAYWAWRLGRQRHETSGKAKRRKRQERVEFVELVQPPPGTASLQVEVVLGNGTTLRVPVGFDEETVGRLLRLLGAV